MLTTSYDGNCEASQFREFEVVSHVRVFVPNAFTPNGDGLNDWFAIFGRRVETYQLEVYDRNGSLLFLSEDISQSWDGTIKGTPAAEGSYSWRISGVSDYGTPYEMQGSVLLLY
jgi:gliding motility-associated-like protein